MRAKHGLH